MFHCPVDDDISNKALCFSKFLEKRFLGALFHKELIDLSSW